MHSYLESTDGLGRFDELEKATFLSYFISLYISTIEHKNRNQSVTVDEIYDFIQDLHSELYLKIPILEKGDISSCFQILDKLGVCTCLK